MICIVTQQSSAMEKIKANSLEPVQNTKSFQLLMLIFGLAPLQSCLLIQMRWQLLEGQLKKRNFVGKKQL